MGNIKINVFPSVSGTKSNDITTTSHSETMCTTTAQLTVTLAQINLTGTVEVTNTSVSVIGTSTLFTTELSVGDTLTIVGVDYIVDSIVGDTLLFLTVAYAGATASGFTIKKNNGWVEWDEIGNVVVTGGVNGEAIVSGDHIYDVTITGFQGFATSALTETSSVTMRLKDTMGGSLISSLVILRSHTTENC